MIIPLIKIQAEIIRQAAEDGQAAPEAIASRVAQQLGINEHLVSEAMRVTAGAAQ